MRPAAIMAPAANRSRTNRTMMIPISAPPKHRSQANAATSVGSRQLKQYVEYECCKFGRGRIIGSGVIRRLSAANATRPEKRSGPSANREVARIESDCRADRFDARQALAAYGLFYQRHDLGR